MYNLVLLTIELLFSIYISSELIVSLAKSSEVPESSNSTACIQFSAAFATDFNINISPSPPANATRIGTTILAITFLEHDLGFFFQLLKV